MRILYLSLLALICGLITPPQASLKILKVMRPMNRSRSRKLSISIKNFRTKRLDQRRRTQCVLHAA